MLTDEEKQKVLAELVSAAEGALAKAEAFAAEHKLEFSFEPAYGMGGYFGEVTDEWGDEEKGEWGWNPSSQSC